MRSCSGDTSVASRLMVALDLPDAASALAMRDRLGDLVGWFKVGMRLFVREGPGLLCELQQHHAVFLDLKFHDIPNTVAQAVTSAGELGVAMVNVHASGGAEMLRAAAGAATDFPEMRLIAVTVLTSDALPPEQARAEVQARAQLARSSGLGGVVCSVHEVAAVRAACGEGFITVTPGIRMPGADVQDQARVADPRSAIAAGSDYLVVGRPIIQAEQPEVAVRQVLAAMREGQGDASA